MRILMEVEFCISTMAIAHFLECFPRIASVKNLNIKGKMLVVYQKSELGKRVSVMLKFDV
jgi:hypothetical protein